MRLSRHFIVLVIYTILAIVLTFPLITKIADHVPGTSIWSLDEYGYVWNHWWFKYSLLGPNSVSSNLNPFSTDFLFYPLGASLVLYAYTWLHVAIGLPLQLSIGLIPAVNITVLFSFVVAAFGMYLFVYYLLRVSLRIWDERYEANLGSVARDTRLHMLAAFVAGIAFAFASNRFVYVSLGHYNIVASEWLPFYLLFLFKTLLEPGFKNALLAGLFAAFALYTETTDGVLLALLTIVILAFEWRLVSNRATLKRLVVVGATALVLFAPLLFPTLREIFASGYSLPGWGHSEKLLVDLAGFFAPTSLNPLNRGWEAELDAVRQGISRFSDVNTFFVGYATAILALAGFLLFARRNRLWLFVVLIFAILAMGPLLHINGSSEFDLDGLATTVPLPFFVLHYIPILKENRVPNRYSILVVIGLAVLIAYAVWWLLARIASGESRSARILGVVVCGIVSAALILEHLAVPLPLTDASVPEIYNQIGKDPGNFTVLSLPLGWRNSFGQLGAEDTRSQYYQSADEKFLITGQIQRNPDSLFQYFENAPVIRSIIALEEYKDIDERTLKDDKAIAGMVAYFFDLRYLVANAAVPNRPPYSDNRDRVLDYATKVFPIGEKVYDREGTVAYRIVQPVPSTPLKVDVGSDIAKLFFGDGWTNPEDVADATAVWGTTQNARIFLPIRDPHDYQLTIRALPFIFPGASTQSITPRLNGHDLPRVDLGPGWNDYKLLLPRDSLKSGLNELAFEFGYVVRPHDVLPTQYDIGQTGVKSPVDISAQSTSDFGSVKVNGKEVSPLKRGYNFVLINPNSGVVIETKSFDTGGTSTVESRSMRDFINKISLGTIVVGVVQDDASASLGEGAVAAIQSLGLSTNLRGKNGNSHAFIAVKGKAGGMEQTGEGPSTISVGHSLDDRPLSVAIDSIILTPQQ